jgi:hypothetical protein
MTESGEAVRATRVGERVIGCEKPDLAMVLRRSMPSRERAGAVAREESIMRGR